MTFNSTKLKISFSIRFLILADAIVIGLLVFLLILPSYKKMEDASNKVISSKKTLEGDQEILDNLKEIREEYQQIQDDIEKVNMVLPQGEKISELLTQLEAMTLDAGLFCESIKPIFTEEEISSVAKAQEQKKGEIKSPTSYKPLGISLELSGNYESFKKYLYNIEKNIRIIDVTSISIKKPSSEEGGENLFDFALELKTYYQ